RNACGGEVRCGGESGICDAVDRKRQDAGGTRKDSAEAFGNQRAAEAERIEGQREERGESCGKDGSSGAGGKSSFASNKARTGSCKRAKAGACEASREEKEEIDKKRSRGPVENARLRVAFLAQAI